MVNQTRHMGFGAYEEDEDQNFEEVEIDDKGYTAKDHDGDVEYCLDLEEGEDTVEKMIDSSSILNDDT